MVSEKNKGITLVALVITIIILLILAGITISSLTNTGLFGKAQEAKEKTKAAEANQTKILDEYETVLNQYDEKTLIYKVNNGEIKIGDYVKYIPDTLANTDSQYTTLMSNLKTYSGSNNNTNSTLSQELNTNWRVLDVKDGQVRLISEKPTKSTIKLKGFNGYNNVVGLIDNACSTLYSNTKLAKRVQNLKIEDIQDQMVETDYSKIANVYGTIVTPGKKYYPSILLKEKKQKVTIGENTNEGKELDLSEQTEFINQTTISKADKLEVQFTGWGKQMEIGDFKNNNSKYYELFMGSDSNQYTYWISSRCIGASSQYASFCVRCINNGISLAYGLCYSDGTEEDEYDYAFRPVITLNSNVQVTSGNGSSESPFNIQ